MIRNYLLLLVMVLAPFSKLLSQATSKGYNIEVNLDGFNDGTKVYLIDLDASDHADSAYLMNGRAEFKGKLIEPTVFRLLLENNTGYLNFWGDNVDIRLAGNKQRFPTMEVKGSPLNLISEAVDNQHIALDRRRDILADTAFNDPDEKKRSAAWERVKAIDEEVLRIRIHTIVTFAPSLVTIKELYFLRNDLKNDSLQHLFDRFPTELKKTKYGQVITKYLATNDLQTGVQAPEIAGKDLNNKVTKLSAYRNKIVLLDFWASWCSPCRQGNRQLVEVYKKYSAKGFEIISFYVDTNMKLWKAFSKEDGILWTNISDLKGFYSEQAAAYKIRAIPKAFLIGMDGKILHIFGGYDDNNKVVLEEKLRELL